MTAPEEIEVARRNLVAELKAIRGGSRNYQGLYEINDRTLADLIEVLEAVRPARVLQCSNCDSPEFVCGGCGVLLDVNR